MHECSLCDNRGYFHVRLAGDQGMEKQSCPCQSLEHQIRQEVKRELEKLEQLERKVIEVKTSLEQKLTRLHSLHQAARSVN